VATGERPGSDRRAARAGRSTAQAGRRRSEEGAWRVLDRKTVEKSGHFGCAAAARTARHHTIGSSEGWPAGALFAAPGAPTQRPAALNTSNLPENTNRGGLFSRRLRLPSRNREANLELANFASAGVGPPLTEEARRHLGRRGALSAFHAQRPSGALCARRSPQKVYANARHELTVRRLRIDRPCCVARWSAPPEPCRSPGAAFQRVGCHVGAPFGAADPLPVSPSTPKDLR
jgi:hypothetical protein